jgi:hypothetical protein
LPVVSQSQSWRPLLPAKLTFKDEDKASKKPSFVKLDRHPVRAIRLWLGAQHFSMDRHLRSEDRRTLCSREPNNQGKIRTRFDVASEAHIQPPITDVLDHGLDLEFLPFGVLSSNCCREPLKDPQRPPPLASNGRGRVVCRPFIRAIYSKALNSAILCQASKPLAFRVRRTYGKLLRSSSAARVLGQRVSEASSLLLAINKVTAAS